MILGGQRMQGVAHRVVEDPDHTVVGRIWYGLFELWIGDEEGTNNTLVDDWAHRIPLRIEDPDYLLNGDRSWDLGQYKKGSWDLGPYGEKGGAQWKLVIHEKNRPPEAQNARRVLIEKGEGHPETLILSKAETKHTALRRITAYNSPQGIVLALGNLFSPISPVNK